MTHGLQPTRLLCPRGFSRHKYWNGLPCSPPGNLPKPGIEPRSPTVQTYSLLTELPKKPKDTGVGSLSLLQGIFLTQKLNCVLLHCMQILYQLSFQGSPICLYTYICKFGGSIYTVVPDRHFIHHSNEISLKILTFDFTKVCRLLQIRLR